MSRGDQRRVLETLYRVAVDASRPERCVPEALHETGVGAWIGAARGRTYVFGAGKAAASMARAVERFWVEHGGEDALEELSGTVVTRYGYREPCERIAVLEAGHPVPDAASERAARRLLAELEALGAGDRALGLISGGGSALLAAPAPGLTLEDKRRVTVALLRSGASIGEINSVRKQLSAVKGGRLGAAAAPTPTVTLIISDVAGDDPATIASGPTVADVSTPEDALEVLHRYSIHPPGRVTAYLEERAGAAGAFPAMDHVENRVVASAHQGLEAAAREARQQGYTPLILGDALEGEARELARTIAGIAREAVRYGHPVAPPAVVLSGGEATVTLQGEGRGGPNTEFALALALHLAGEEGIHALAADTDGIDGTGDNAGAHVAPWTLEMARSRGIVADEHLAENDSYGFFERTGGLFAPGPTGTNINDFRAVLIEDPQALARS